MDLFGFDYLTTLNYVMAVCVMCVSVITNSITKIGALKVSQQLLDVRKMFMRYISHEIRTPLNVVCMGLNLLYKDLTFMSISTCNQCLATLKETQSSCDIAVSILDDMLLFDKVESGLLQLELVSISPWNVFKTSVEPFYVQVSGDTSLSACCLYTIVILSFKLSYLCRLEKQKSF